MGSASNVWVTSGRGNAVHCPCSNQQQVYSTTGRTLKIEYGEMKLEYRTPEQLEQQLGALEKILHLTVRVVKSETSKV